MLKAQIFSTTPMNALTSTTKKKKNPSQLGISKKTFFFFWFLLVNDCILMYLKTTILCIYNFLILYRCLFDFFFSYILAPCSVKSWVRPCLLRIILDYLKFKHLINDMITNFLLAKTTFLSLYFHAISTLVLIFYFHCF